MKNPPRQRGGGLKLYLSASDSLAVFYVEQVALNRHVSNNSRIPKWLLSVKAYSAMHQVAWANSKKG